MEKREEAVRALQLLTSQADAIVQQMNLIQNAINDATETIEALKSLESSAEILYPIGSGVYVRGEIKEVDEVLMSIGSGVVVKRTKERAISLLEDRVKEMNKRLEELASKYNEIAGEVEKIKEQLEEKR
jgi:prefoldin alpha subunit